MRFYFMVLFILIVFTQNGNAAMSEDEKLNAFFEEEWEYGIKRNPLYATILGDLRYNDQLPDVSLEAVKQEQAHDLEVLKKLQAIDRSKLSETNQLNYDLYLLNLKQSVEGHRFPDYVVMINQMGGIQQQAPDAVTQLPFKNVKHYEDYITRLNKFPVMMDQTIDRMKEGLKMKVTPPKITLRAVADQIKAHVVDQVEKSAFNEPFQKFPEEISKADQDRLRTQGKQAIQTKVVPAYQKLHEFWTKEYFPNTRETIGISSLPDGKEWYAYLARTSTTTDLTPQQIHEIGLREVARIRSEMDKVITETGFKGSFDEFLHFLRSDPRFFYTKPEELLTGYRDICKRIDAELPKLFGKLPRTPYGVREIPEYSAPSQTTAYYNEGNLKAGRPGWYYANTYRLEMRPKWEMEALSIHEAVPGHHLQISLAQELENVPKFRNFGHYTAFVEGWGLYSESLGPELGLYKDNYSKFGQLAYEMWRAIRLVVDTGIHVMGWDRQKAIDYFMANASKSEHDITVEVDRYIVWPGQALAYKIGELKIQELRKQSQKELGERFDIREFHDVVLGSGAIPLSILENNVKKYIQSKM
ncbi:DUF885 domain-containing protein [bacterium]|nr:DUF885 domain-containing protein [bacterium]